ncbi:unnamed protein product, partial [Didymodactylos carnosus]
IILIFVELKTNMRRSKAPKFLGFLNRLRVKSHYDSRTLHIFARNDQMNEHNQKMLKDHCKDIVAISPIKKTSTKSDRITLDILELGIGAEVMITKNSNIPDGFANGSFCTIIAFVYNDDGTTVEKIVLKSHEARVGIEHRQECVHCRELNSICIGRTNVESDENNPMTGRSRFFGQQFPVKLAWAATVDKIQGSSTILRPCEIIQ